jgi:hypothetical protein
LPKGTARQRRIVTFAPHLRVWAAAFLHDDRRGGRCNSIYVSGLISRITDTAICAIMSAPPV